MRVFARILKYKDMIIKKIELLNFQVIKEFKADFEGNVYFIKGDNELGKSTLLKAIGALLTGSRDNVLSRGEKKGFAKMIVGDNGEEYEVSLSFSEKNPRGNLTIKQKNTGLETNNVTMLQKIFGYQDFDAVEFSNWSESAEGRRKQIEVVKALLPEDVKNRIDEIDREVAELKENRTFLNRELKSATIVFDSLKNDFNPEIVSKYSTKKDISSLMEKQKTQILLIEKYKKVKEARDARIKEIDEIPSLFKNLKLQINNKLNNIYSIIDDAEEAYKKAIQEAENRKKEILSRYKNEIEELKVFEIEEKKKIEEKKVYAEQCKLNADEWLKKFEKNKPDEMSVSDMIKDAEEHNRIVDEVVDFLNKKKVKENKEREVSEVEKTLKSLQEERAALISGSKLPIEKLSFTNEGLILDNIPFQRGHVSDSQIMEVATKLIIASNPKVKVFRIARGESLGEKRLKSIIEIANKNGFQGFIEEVKRGQSELLIEEYTESEQA